MEHTLEKIFLQQRKDLLGSFKQKDFKDYLKLFPLLEAKQTQIMLDVLSDMRSFLVLKAFGSHGQLSEACAEVKEQEINFLKLKRLNLKPTGSDFVKLYRYAKAKALDLMFGGCSLDSEKVHKVLLYFSKLDAFNREIDLIMEEESDDRYFFAKAKSHNKKFIVFLEKVESFTDLQLLKDCFKDDLLLEMGLTETSIRLLLEDSDYLRQEMKFSPQLAFMSRPQMS